MAKSGTSERTQCMLMPALALAEPRSMMATVEALGLLLFRVTLPLPHLTLLHMLESLNATALVSFAPSALGEPSEPAAPESDDLALWPPPFVFCNPSSVHEANPVIRS